MPTIAERLVNEGKAEGRKEAKLEMATNLLENGQQLDFIEKITGVSAKEMKVEYLFYIY